MATFVSKATNCLSNGMLSLKAIWVTLIHCWTVLGSTYNLGREGGEKHLITDLKYE